MKKPVNVFSFSIQNSAENSVDIFIDGDIVDASTQAVIKAWFGDETSTSYKSFRDQLSASKAEIFNVYVNSPGGHVGDALAIYDLLVDMQNKGKTVNTEGRGIVASSATLILLASKNPKMSANSFFMVHTVSGGIFGTVDQVENYAKTMRTFNTSIVNVYSERSGMKASEVSKLMENETWMTAKDAKAKGFIAEVTGEQPFTNKIDAETWDFSNKEILNQYNSFVKPPEESNILNDMKKLFNDFKDTITAAIKGVSVTKDTDNQSLINSIAEVVGKTFGDMGEQFENSVKELITAANKDQTQQAVTAAVTEAVKNLNEKITALEGKIGGLETEIENKIAGATNQGVPAGETKEPWGAFS